MNPPYPYWMVGAGPPFNTSSRAITKYGTRVPSALVANRWLNAIRRKLGLRYWSLSAYLKQRVKNAVTFVENFESAVIEEARRRGFDGVVCGHIHKAEIRDFDGVTYYNDGDWVESCTALVEHFDGRIEVLRWTELRESPVDPLQELLVSGVAV